MRIIVELELNEPYELSEDEIINDLLAGEDQIGWEHDYTIKSILKDVTGEEAGYIADVLDAAVDIPEQELNDTQWVYEPDRTNHWHCSGCGYVTGVSGLMGNYCPHCGAKMRKKDREELRKEVQRDATD